MAILISKKDAATHKGCTKSNISNNIKRGKIIAEDDGRIDMDHPINKEFFSRPKLQSVTTVKAEQKKAKDKKAKEKKKDPNTITVEMTKPPLSAADPGEQGQLDYGIDVLNFNPAQKILEDTRLKKAQADLKNLELAQKVGLTIDIEALKQKFGTYNHFVMNDLIPMPEAVADLVVKRVLAAMAADEDPVLAVTEELKDHVADIIERAQRAAAAVMPPAAGVKYIMLEVDGEPVKTDNDEES